MRSCREVLEILTGSYLLGLIMVCIKNLTEIFMNNMSETVYVPDFFWIFNSVVKHGYFVFYFEVSTGRDHWSFP